MNYSKWDDIARDEVAIEKAEKDETRVKNREKYFKDQEVKKVKYVKDQEEKKNSAAVAHAHTHTHDHDHDHSSSSSTPSHPLLSSVPRPSCGCGFADVDELRRSAALAASIPAVSAADKYARKLDAVRAAREHGKQLFGERNFDQAFAVYERGVLIISGMFAPSTADGATQDDIDASTAELIEMEVALDLNMSACKLAQLEYTDALSQARMALQLDPKSAKGHYRSACAYRGLGDYVAARASLTKCIDADPITCKRDVDKMLSLIIIDEKKEKAKQKEFQKQLEARIAAEKNAFGGVGGAESAAEGEKETKADSDASVVDDVAASIEATPITTST